MDPSSLDPYLERLAAGGVRLRAAPEPLRGPDSTGPARLTQGARQLDLQRLGTLMEYGDGERGADAATLLIARTLSNYAPAGTCERAWDLGCGTGVLAVALARCGAGRVRASDSDPVCVDLARQTSRAARVTVDIREGALLEPFADEPAEDLLVTNLPHKPCAPDTQDVSGPFAGPQGDAVYEALRRALLLRAQRTRVVFFLHSLPHPALLHRWSAHFDLTLLAWSRRFLEPTELPHMRRIYRTRHERGLSFLGREVDREFLIGGVFEAVGP